MTTLINVLTKAIGQVALISALVLYILAIVPASVVYSASVQKMQSQVSLLLGDDDPPEVEESLEVEGLHVKEIDFQEDTTHVVPESSDEVLLHMDRNPVLRL